MESSAEAYMTSMRSVFSFTVPSGSTVVPGFHGAAGDEHGRNVETQCRHEHARCDLVAVRDADQRVRTMRVHLVFHRIGDDLAARQGVQHAGVPHGDAVVDGHRVELTRDAAGLLHGLGDETPNFVEMYVPGDEFVEGVGNGDDRLAEILAVNAGRTVERAGTGRTFVRS